ncbi:unnamed protein product, partial [Polarella glacialis]
ASVQEAAPRTFFRSNSKSIAAQWAASRTVSRSASKFLTFDSEVAEQPEMEDEEELLSRWLLLEEKEKAQLARWEARWQGPEQGFLPQLQSPPKQLAASPHSRLLSHRYRSRNRSPRNHFSDTLPEVGGGGSHPVVPKRNSQESRTLQAAADLEAMWGSSFIFPLAPAQ